MTTESRRLALVAFLATAGLLISACSSSGGSPGATKSGENGTAAGNPGLKEAADYIAANARNPTSIGVSDLEEAPPKGKKVIMLLVTPQPIAARVATGMREGSAALGWDFSTINAGSSPADAIKAFEAALQKTPDAICICGTADSTVFTSQIAEAKSKGVTVIQNVGAEGPVDGVLANVAGSDQIVLYAKLVAAYFITESDGKGRAGLFNINAFPILKAFTGAFIAAVKTWCPGCTVDDQNQQLADVGTKTPANVVAYFQRNPQAKWAVFGNGDTALGVSTALKTAGISGINIIGESPSAPNLEALKTGDERAWAGYPVEMMGWRTIDALARHYAGDDVAAAVAVPLPGQMITKANVNTIAIEEGQYVAVAGFRDQFKKAWHVG
ncbi:hypothetical protein Aple_004610 [Acrocarpospora pleiomorpha]|uniref:Periplasmic binding protein domain-containing protein n=1 Tax=Acrocarpospora pleiomorpha TaxID=90975 RepID=A0A5M3XA84_9ACTN|nr:substrate-binding domain-containing protein [Acrocarpospora pleiomorpha]GES17566.1 hypothetical protein Aple_004610 [Acrocarpospora pleiomorpha]